MLKNNKNFNKNIVCNLHCIWWVWTKNKMHSLSSYFEVCPWASLKSVPQIHLLPLTFLHGHPLWGRLISVSLWTLVQAAAWEASPVPQAPGRVSSAWPPKHKVRSKLVPTDKTIVGRFTRSTYYGCWHAFFSTNSQSFSAIKAFGQSPKGSDYIMKMDLVLACIYLSDHRLCIKFEYI